jgi:hypothetical protein
VKNSDTNTAHPCLLTDPIAGLWISASAGKLPRQSKWGMQGGLIGRTDFEDMGAK